MPKIPEVGLAAIIIIVTIMMIVVVVDAGAQDSRGGPDCEHGRRRQDDREHGAQELLT